MILSVANFLEFQAAGSVYAVALVKQATFPAVSPEHGRDHDPTTPLTEVYAHRLIDE